MKNLEQYVAIVNYLPRLVKGAEEGTLTALSECDYALTSHLAGMLSALEDVVESGASLLSNFSQQVHKYAGVPTFKVGDRVVFCHSTYVIKFFDGDYVWLRNLSEDTYAFREKISEIEHGPKAQYKAGDRVKVRWGGESDTYYATGTVVKDQDGLVQVEVLLDHNIYSDFVTRHYIFPVNSWVKGDRVKIQFHSDHNPIYGTVVSDLGDAGVAVQYDDGQRYTDTISREYVLPYERQRL